MAAGEVSGSRPPGGTRAVRDAGEPAGGWPFRRATSGPLTDWWVYEDLQYAVVAGMASAGKAPEEIGKEPVSYDEMRPGFYEPKARLDDMTANHVERSLCFPDLSEVLRADLPRGEGQRARAGVRACLQRLDGRGVVR